MIQAVLGVVVSGESSGCWILAVEDWSGKLFGEIVCDEPLSCALFA